MKTRWHIEPFVSHTKFRLLGLLGFAVLVAASAQPAAHAQGIVRVSRETVAPVETAAVDNRVPSAPPLVYNAATLPVSVLDKTLALRAEQKAAIVDLQTALQAKQQAVSTLRAVPAQTVVGADIRQNAATAANTGGAADPAVVSTEAQATNAQMTNAQMTNAQMTNAQMTNEAFLRLRAAEQALAWDEQVTVRKIRALLTMEQIAQLRTTESDALLFDSVGLPVDLLAQIVLAPNERANITTIFKTARRQFQRATRQSDRDVIQNEARAQSLAALAPQNKSVADAYIKAHPTPTLETQK